MRYFLLLAIASMLAACAVEREGHSPEMPGITATNAFYYYDDIDSAWRFYREVLGFETVVDYGFAKILRLAGSSYLTLVQASEGMHSADEPKTVTLTLVTDELRSWREHLASRAVDTVRENANALIVMDPGGYTLRFLRFNPHPSVDGHVAGFAMAVPVPAKPTGADAALSVRATALTVYFDRRQDIRPFYESLFGMQPAGELGGQVLYQISTSGFLVLNQGGDALHTPTEKNGVTLSFLTSDVDGWFGRAHAEPGFRLRTEEILNEGGRVRVFVGYDPAGTFLEWDTFLPANENSRLLGYLP